MNSVQPAIIASASALSWADLWLGAGVCLPPVVAALLFWQAWSAPRRGERILGGVGGALISLGALGATFFFLYPPQHNDAMGNLIGEMPPEFGFCVGLVGLGLAVALGLLVIKAARSIGARAAR